MDLWKVCTSSLMFLMSFFFFFFCLQESDSQPCLAELFIGTYLDMTVTKDLKSIKVRSDLWLLSFILQVLIIPEQFRPAR